MLALTKETRDTEINSYPGCFFLFFNLLNLRHFVWKNRKTKINSCPDRGRLYIIRGGEELEYENKARDYVPEKDSPYCQPHYDHYAKFQKKE